MIPDISALLKQGNFVLKTEFSFELKYYIIYRNWTMGCVTTLSFFFWQEYLCIDEIFGEKCIDKIFDEKMH